MTNGEKLKEIFLDAEITIVKSNYGRTKVAVDWKFEQIPSYYNLFYEDWWNAEYKEPAIEHEQKINKSAMMQEIYMEGVNMGGEYQGCWVRFKEIEKIVDKYVR